MRIDIHAHYFPDQYVDRLAAMGRSIVRNVKLAPGADLTVDERLDLLDRAGIDMQVLSVGPQVPYDQDRDRAEGTAKLANDLYCELCQLYPRRFAALGTVPLPHGEAAAREAVRALDELGMKGISVGCSVLGQPLDDPAFDPLWEELDRRETALFLHPVGAGAGPLSADFGLTWIIGAPVEDTTAALRLVLSGWADRYPRIKVVVPHLGGILPFLIQRLEDEVGRQRVHLPGQFKIEGSPIERLLRFHYDTVNRQPSALQCACAAFGAERLLLGTDFPYLSGPELVDCVDYVQASLSTEDAGAVLDGNAPRLLGLAPIA